MWPFLKADPERERERFTPGHKSELPSDGDNKPINPNPKKESSSRTTIVMMMMKKKKMMERERERGNKGRGGFTNCTVVVERRWWL